MKIYMNVTAPKRTESKLVALQCDLCGTRSERIDGWSNSKYGISETRVFMREGTSFGDTGHGKTINFDICPTCFVDRVLPFLQPLAKTEVKWEEWDY